MKNQTSDDVVVVLAPDGQELRPTRPAKARILLSKGKATVAERRPYTIRLTYWPPALRCRPGQAATTGSS